MYLALMVAHNLLRLAVVLLGLWAIVEVRGKQQTTIVARGFAAVLLVEVLLGGWLWWASPLVQSALANPNFMTFELGFFVWLHPLLAALVVGLVVIALRRTGHMAWWWWLAAYGLLLLSIPWWRPLLRI